MTLSRFSHVTCLTCGHTMPPDPLLIVCERCKGAWLDAAYDYADLRWPEVLTRRSPGLWRYRELLPFAFDRPPVSIGEGYTPLLRAEGLQLALNHPQLWIKDERQSPTGSFKDRQGTVSVSILKALGVRECVLASTGNAAAAYAAYCARAGIKLWVFLTSMAPAEKMRELGLYGAEVVKVTGTYDEAKTIAADFARRRGLYFDRGAKAVPGKESMKTIAYEIAEQLGLETTDGKHWIAPDWYLQAVSGGIGPLGVMKGFRELHQLGLIDRIPKLAVIQVEGCSPMVSAFQKQQETATAVTPNTRITVLSTGDPGYAYTLLYRLIGTQGGTMASAEDGEAFRAMRRVARIEGLSVEPATAVAFAGLEKLIAAGTIRPDESVVINCSGHTFPAEKHILEDQYVLDLELGELGGSPTGVQEGLGAALERLDEQIRTVVVIDDNPQDSRLIRRLLQAHKNYRVFESNNPLDGIELVKQRQPGLVITDLTMPGIDGFSLLERLKGDPATAQIPVIILSGKMLTAADEKRLQGRPESVWQKGNFNTRELVDHVVSTLNDSLIPDNRPDSTLPSSPAPSHLKTPSPAAAPTIPPADLQPLTIPPHAVLVIDDNARDARLVRRILEAEKRYRVIEASTAAEGLTAMQQSPPDLLLLDLVLPDKSGLDLLDELRANPELRHIPIIVLTGKDLSAEERVRLAGVPIWPKGNLDRRRLLESVKQALP